MEEQKQDIENLTYAEYYRPYLETVDNSKGKIKLEKALERAWANRDFEIDKYWARATYFWAFIAAAFAGYLTIVSSDKLDEPFKSELAYILICMGTVFTASWFMVNLGSKKWQENWEKHIDMLENHITGPLYKTVLVKTGFSVSKVNTCTSVFIFIVWVALGIIQGLGLSKPAYYYTSLKIDWVILLLTVMTSAFLFFMYRYCKNGIRAEKLDRKFSFNRRKSHFYVPLSSGKHE
jgi:hypothetical protein